MGLGSSRHLKSGKQAPKTGCFKPNTQPGTPDNDVVEIDSPTTVTIQQSSFHEKFSQNVKTEPEEPIYFRCGYNHEATKTEVFKQGKMLGSGRYEDRTPANEVDKIDNKEKMDSTTKRLRETKNFLKNLFRLKSGSSKSSKKVKREDNQQAREKMDPRQENNRNEASMSAARSQQNLKIHSLENEDQEEEHIKAHNQKTCVSTCLQDPPSETKTEPMKPLHLTHGYNPLREPFKLYKRGKLLGSGGSGHVFEAERVSDGYRVALKVIPQHQVNIRYHLDCEYPIPVEVLCMLQVQKGSKHPSIIRLLEWYALKTHYVYVLELPPDSEDLSKYITRHGGCLDESTAHIIMHQVVQAAKYCYNKGVAHCDIKPNNLLINRKTLNVKLIDFGSAESNGSYYTAIKGTKAYYPPEAFIKKQYHEKSAGVWSLGILLFQMVCGRFPSTDDLHKIYTKLWKHKSMSGDLSDLICSCLQYKPKQRIHLKNMHCHPWFKVLTKCIEKSQCSSIPNTEPRTSVNDVVEIDRPTTVTMGQSSSHNHKAEQEQSEVLKKYSSPMCNSNKCTSSKLSSETERKNSKCVSTCVQDPPSETKTEPMEPLYLTRGHNPLRKPIKLYKRGKMLGSGESGKVFEGERVSDGYRVALKFIPQDKVKIMYQVDDSSRQHYPIPVEVSCMLQVQYSHTPPSIIRLLEWYALETHYVYVLELPPDSEDLSKYITRHGGCLNERTAHIIMWQVVQAAKCCYNKGVAHRDIKPSNLLINCKTLKVRLIDFGSADFTETYCFTKIEGAEAYYPPEAFIKKWYHGKTAAVWSLGILLFQMVCGHLPSADDLHRIYANTWKHESMSEDLSDLIRSCLQYEPKKRIDLTKMHFHPWFCTDRAV